MVPLVMTKTELWPREVAHRRHGGGCGETDRCEGFQTFVEPDSLAEPLCGAVRPGHFRRVATVVAKLFNIVQPDFAFFGQKDFQLRAVVRQMVQDLNLAGEIINVPTVREADGLCMSGRNSYLGPSGRRRALCLSQALFAAESAFGQGERGTRTPVKLAVEHMADVNQLQYLELRDAATLQRLTGPISQPAVLCVAAYVGATHLIDNLVLNPSSMEIGGVERGLLSAIPGTGEPLPLRS
ncbi:pantoate--beta-alanine ligase [Mesorhizobium australicum]|uniref:4-phosphopantoate--beta-alanine ligase n=1 Tax=Mesorhizobium australicum TaxID=536018 RepID=UPI003339C289